MSKVRIYFVASIPLLVVGGILFLLGLPYAITHFGGPSFRYCCGMANPSIDWVLKKDTTFAFFMPYGLISLVVGALLFLAYKVERHEILDKP